MRPDYQEGRWLLTARNHRWGRSDRSHRMVPLLRLRLFRRLRYPGRLRGLWDPENRLGPGNHLDPRDQWLREGLEDQLAQLSQCLCHYRALPRGRSLLQVLEVQQVPEVLVDHVDWLQRRPDAGRVWIRGRDPLFCGLCQSD